MATLTTFQIASAKTPHRSPGPWVIRRRFTTGTSIANADVVNICTIPKNAYVVNGLLYQNGTLGASATAQLRRQSTALTAATTAGSAGGVAVTIADTPNTADGTDVLNVLAGGANWGTSAVMTVQVTLDWIRADLES